MSENILEKIIKTKIEKIDVLKKSLKIDSLKNRIDENKSFIAGDLSGVQNKTFYTKEKGKS